MKANDVIDFIPLLKTWKEGPHNANDVCVYQNVAYRCITSHDSTGNPMWNPADAKSLWASYHGTDKNHALPYSPPTGAHDAYMRGEWMLFTDGQIYLCLQDNVVHAPDVLPSVWESESTQGGD